jgi:hypothetical protein
MLVPISATQCACGESAEISAFPGAEGFGATMPGGWPRLQSARDPRDSDQDGMPDVWEKRYGLNPRDPSDASADKDRDGYTNLEEYLNGTDPKRFVDYRDPKNNVSSLAPARPRSSR